MMHNKYFHNKIKILYSTPCEIKKNSVALSASKKSTSGGVYLVGNSPS